jgi:hypothetical protein
LTIPSFRFLHLLIFFLFCQQIEVAQSILPPPLSFLLSKAKLPKALKRKVERKENAKLKATNITKPKKFN